MIDSRSQTRTHSRDTQLCKELSVYQGLPLDTDEAGSSIIKHKEAHYGTLQSGRNQSWGQDYSDGIHVHSLWVARRNNKNGRNSSYVCNRWLCSVGHDVIHKFVAGQSIWN